MDNAETTARIRRLKGRLQADTSSLREFLESNELANEPPEVEHQIRTLVSQNRRLVAQLSTMYILSLSGQALSAEQVEKLIEIEAYVNSNEAEEEGEEEPDEASVHDDWHEYELLASAPQEAAAALSDAACSPGTASSPPASASPLSWYPEPVRPEPSPEVPTSPALVSPEPQILPTARTPSPTPSASASPTPASPPTPTPSPPAPASPPPPLPPARRFVPHVRRLDTEALAMAAEDVRAVALRRPSRTEFATATAVAAAAQRSEAVTRLRLAALEEEVETLRAERKGADGAAAEREDTLRAAVRAAEERAREAEARADELGAQAEGAQERCDEAHAQATRLEAELRAALEKNAALEEALAAVKAQEPEPGEIRVNAPAARRPSQRSAAAISALKKRTVALSAALYYASSRLQMSKEDYLAGRVRERATAQLLQRACAERERLQQRTGALDELREMLGKTLAPGQVQRELQAVGACSCVRLEELIGRLVSAETAALRDATLAADEKHRAALELATQEIRRLKAEAASNVASSGRRVAENRVSTRASAAAEVLLRKLMSATDRVDEQGSDADGDDPVHRRVLDVLRELDFPFRVRLTHVREGEYLADRHLRVGLVGESRVPVVLGTRFTLETYLKNLYAPLAPGARPLEIGELVPSGAPARPVTQPRAQHTLSPLSQTDVTPRADRPEPSTPPKIYPKQAAATRGKKPRTAKPRARAELGAEPGQVFQLHSARKTQFHARRASGEQRAHLPGGVIRPPKSPQARLRKSTDSLKK